jgi:hypothetical protein
MQLPLYFNEYLNLPGSWGYAVGIATGCELDGQGVGVRGPGRGKEFPLSTSSGPIQPPIQWAPVFSFLGGKDAGAWGWPLTSN